MGLCAFAVVPPARGPVGERPGRMGESGGPRPAVPWRPVLSQSPSRVSKRPGPVPGSAKGGLGRERPGPRLRVEGKFKGGLRRERPGPRPSVEETISTRTGRRIAGCMSVAECGPVQSEEKGFTRPGPWPRAELRVRTDPVRPPAQSQKPSTSRAGAGGM
jgi:hypothetical protein